MITDQIQIALVTALLSAGTTYLALVTKIRRDLEAQYDKDLRDRRLAAYRVLWTLTEPLARYSPAEALTRKGAGPLSERLRKWYFQDGLVMSGAAREAYFTLQKKLVAAATAQTGPLDSKAVEKILEGSSRMHAALCGDVGSRRPPMIGTDSKHWWQRALGRATAESDPVRPVPPSP
jgi:hypothetical protein